MHSLLSPSIRSSTAAHHAAGTAAAAYYHREHYLKIYQLITRKMASSSFLLSQYSQIKTKETFERGSMHNLNGKNL
jgi:hypothetical protein